MAEIELKGNIKVVVNNGGIITLVADTDDICVIQIHPIDLTNLVDFLVAHGYNLTKGGRNGRNRVKE